MNSTIWKKTIESFHRIAKDAIQVAKTPGCKALRDVCERAGELLFDMIAENMFAEKPYRFSVPAWAVERPVEKTFILPTFSHVEDDKRAKYRGIPHFDAYWLCVLAEFNNSGTVPLTFNQHLIHLVPPTYNDTPNAKEYVSWEDFAGFQEEFPDVKIFQYFLNDEKYIADVCDASIRFCDILEKIIEQHASAPQDSLKPAEAPTTSDDASNQEDLQSVAYQPLPEKRIELSTEDKLCIRIDSQWYDLTGQQWKLLNKLIEAAGGWRTNYEIGGEGFRSDKVMNPTNKRDRAMPQQVQNIIDSHQSYGKRIKPEFLT